MIQPQQSTPADLTTLLPLASAEISYLNPLEAMSTQPIFDSVCTKIS